MARKKKTVDVRVSGEVSIEITLTLPNQIEEEEILEEARQKVCDALKQALDDMPEIATSVSVEAYCEPQDLVAEIDE